MGPSILTTYMPDATPWDKLRKASGIITVSIPSGIFDHNLLASNGGPFHGMGAKFTVTKP